MVRYIWHRAHGLRAEGKVRLRVAAGGCTGLGRARARAEGCACGCVPNLKLQFARLLCAGSLTAKTISFSSSVAHATANQSPNLSTACVERQ
jgi:hypothetical protein|tara:strand:- start:566 stop:841 length:276 start_codon:yes stop_codon:yes gene_type:complete